MDCKICFESYNCQERKPMSISCGHSFCYECLKSLKTSNSYECPTCRQPIKSELPNYTVLDIIDSNQNEEPNSELTDEIQKALKELEERQASIDSKCKQKLTEIKNKMESIKSTVNFRADELRQKIQSRQDSILTEADELQKVLKIKVKKLLNENQTAERLEYDKLQKKEFEKLKSQLNTKIKQLKANQNELSQVDDLFEFIPNKENELEIGSFKSKETPQNISSQTVQVRLPRIFFFLFQLTNNKILFHFKSQIQI